VKLLNDLLETTLTDDDVEYHMKLGKDNGEITRTKVVFKSAETMKQVIKNRRKLKNKQIWLSDDLTQHRSNLAYLARRAVKNSKINQTWTADGKVFYKTTEDAPARRLMEAKQLPK
jgi:EAL domain-containing protein (putative c-di-GMP-specific phosphodiesterase class I)